MDNRLQNLETRPSPRKIAANAISATQLQEEAVGQGAIAPGIVDTTILAGDSIGSSHIQDLIINEMHLFDGAISTIKIAANAVTEAQLAANSVTSTIIAANAVTSGKIIDDAITNAKIAANAVTGNEILANSVPGTVVMANTLAGNTVIANTLSGNTVIANTLSGNTVIANTLSGNTVIANTLSGNTVIANTLSGNTVIANTISGSTIIANTLSGNTIIANSLQGNTIVANTLFGNTIVAGSITGDLISANAIDGKTITGATIRTAATTSGLRYVQLFETDIKFYDDANNPQGLIASRGTGRGGGIEIVGLAGNEIALYNGSTIVTGPGSYIDVGNASNQDILINSNQEIQLTGKVRLLTTGAYNLTNTSGHAFQIGLNTGDNVRLDTDGIQAVSAGTAAGLNINTFGGAINAGSTSSTFTINGVVNAGTSTSLFTVNGYLRVASTNDVSLSSTNHPLQLGPTSGVNLRLDGNEIQAVNNGSGGTLSLQASGGSTIICSGGGSTFIGSGGGDVTIGNATNTINFVLGSTVGTPITMMFYKWGYSSAIGTSRALSIASTGLVGYASSSRQFKQNIEDLSIDVSSVLSIVPKKFKYKTDVEQFGSAAEMSYGFIAEDLDGLGLNAFVDYDESGKVFGIDYPKYVVALQAVVRSLSDRLDALEAR